MRTTINIPDRLMADVDALFGDKSKTSVICEALEEYIKRGRRERLLALRGKLELKDLSRELEAEETKDAKRLGQKLRTR